jgi:type IV secretory pathway VirB3-like protein
MADNMEALDFSLPVHKSLQQPELLLGVPKPVFALIFCATIVLVNFLGPVFALAALAFYLPCYLLSRQDPLLLTIVMDSLFQVEYLEG